MQESEEMYCWLILKKLRSAVGMMNSIAKSCLTLTKMFCVYFFFFFSAFTVLAFLPDYLKFNVSGENRDTQRKISLDKLSPLLS